MSTVHYVYVYKAAVHINNPKNQNKDKVGKTNKNAAQHPLGVFSTEALTMSYGRIDNMSNNLFVVWMLFDESKFYRSLRFVLCNTSINVAYS